MRIPRRTSQFKRDLELPGRRGKDLAKLEAALSALIDETPLPGWLKDHPLKGPYRGHRECHLESDWLLIYKLEPGAVIFERTRSHADLFE